MNGFISRLGWRSAILTALALAVAGGIAYASVPNSAGVYTACKLNATGTIRLIDTSLPPTHLLGHCTSFETQINWNQQGQPGPRGPIGPAGPAGPAGARGADSTVPGPTGAQGVTGGQGPAGPQGVKGDTGPQGPAGEAGPQGPTGETGPQGPGDALSVHGFTGPIGDITGTGSGIGDYQFVGGTNAVTLTSLQTITATASFGLGAPGTSTVVVLSDVCFQPLGGSVTPVGNHLTTAVSSRAVLSAAATFSRGAGFVTVGACVAIAAGQTLDNNNVTDGWFIVSN
jgi:hypothetical protein